MTYTAIPGQISRIQTMADGSLRVVVDLQEIGDDIEARLLASRRLPGVFAWVPDGADAPDAPESREDGTREAAAPSGDEQPPKGKTPSQRLRGAIYDHFTALGGYDGLGIHFAPFYEGEMERLISDRELEISRASVEVPF